MRKIVALPELRLADEVFVRTQTLYGIAIRVVTGHFTNHVMMVTRITIDKKIYVTEATLYKVKETPLDEYLELGQRGRCQLWFMRIKDEYLDPDTEIRHHQIAKIVQWVRSQHGKLYDYRLIAGILLRLAIRKLGLYKVGDWAVRKLNKKIAFMCSELCSMGIQTIGLTHLKGTYYLKDYKINPALELTPGDMFRHGLLKEVK